jgi:preprotein translocase subunit YajC
MINSIISIGTVCLGMMSPPAGSNGAAEQQSPYVMIGWLLVMVALFYFMLIRPQQRKEKERKRLIEAVKTGDKVVCAGGIIGIVSNIKGNIFTIKTADSTKLEVLKGAVTQVIQKDEDLQVAKKE